MLDFGLAFTERKLSAMRRQGPRVEPETRPAHSLQQKLGDNLFTHTCLESVRLSCPWNQSERVFHCVRYGYGRRRSSEEEAARGESVVKAGKVLEALVPNSK